MPVSETQVNTILNSEANLVDKQLQNIKNTITSQNRTMTLNDSYSKKMAMYTRVVLAVIFALAIAILLNILKTKFSIIPDSVITIAYIILLSSTLIYGMFILSDINSRDKIDFDKLDLSPPSAVTKAMNGVQPIPSSGELDLLPGFCIGKDCCKSGSFFDNDIDKCTQCAKGEYSSMDGAEECTACGKGQYSDITGAASCTNCKAGTYTDKIGSTLASECIACAAGKYSATAGTPCVSCPENTYSSTPGATVCTACPAGKKSLAGSTSESQCQ